MIDPTRVDATPQYALGYRVDDPRAVDFPGNRLRYVRAESNILAGDSLSNDNDETDSPHAVIPSPDASTPVSGVAIVDIDAGQYGWVCVGGYLPDANVADASAQGDKLGPTATAGRLGTPAFTTEDPTSAQLITGLAASLGLGIVAVTAGSAGNRAAIYIY